MGTRFDRQIRLFAILGFAAISAAVIAADATAKTTKAEYKQALASAQADYKKAYAACPPAAGKERLACRRQAQANLEKARGDAREARGMPRNAQGPRE